MLDIEVYKQILRLLALEEDDFIRFWNYLPNDKGVFARGEVAVEEISLFKLLRGCRWYFHHASTHSESSEGIQQIEDYLLWIIDVVRGGGDEATWTTHYVRSQDGWGLMRKLAKKILVDNEWEGEVFLSEEEFIKYCDLDEN